MNLIVDTREKPQAIGKILKQFDELEVKYHRSKLPVGDYMSLDNARLVIDRKQDLQELCGNVCQQHERFTNELKLANELEIELIVLCEHGGNIKTLEDVAEWINPRIKHSPKALTGARLHRILKSISDKYSTEFLFCKKSETGKKIIELLNGETNV